MTPPAIPTRPPSARSTSPARPATGRARATPSGRSRRRPPTRRRTTRVSSILKTRWNDAWKFPAADAKHAQRDQPADAAAMNTCAACHARRSTIAESGTPGAPLEDTHRLALLTAPNYHADGQQREEVYVWSSFLQTTMYQRGVTCMDCHDPHALKLRAEGNALCARCHNAAAVRHGKASFPQGRHEGRAMRRVPHAGAELHGDRRAARPRHPRAASRSVVVARQPECLHPVPRRPQARLGRGGDGQVVRQDLARSPALRHDAARRHDAGREGAAFAARARRAIRRRLPS